MKTIITDIVGLLIIVLMLWSLSSCSINLYEGGTHYHVTPAEYHKKDNIRGIEPNPHFPSVTPHFNFEEGNYIEIVEDVDTLKLKPIGN